MLECRSFSHAGTKKKLTDLVLDHGGGTKKNRQADQYPTEKMHDCAVMHFSSQ